jgi:hypothetical protein
VTVCAPISARQPVRDQPALPPGIADYERFDCGFDRCVCVGRLDGAEVPLLRISMMCQVGFVFFFFAVAIVV